MNIENQMLEGIARLLGILPYRLRRAKDRDRYSTSHDQLHLQATASFGHIMQIYARIHNQQLQFFVKGYSPVDREDYVYDPWILVELDLADPASLTRAKLRASIKEAIRLRDTKY